MFSKSIAAWLVVLVLLPFTAPFPTCDIADLLGGSANSQDFPLAPLSSSSASMAEAASLVFPLATVAGRLRLVALSWLSSSSFVGASLVVIPRRVSPTGLIQRLSSPPPNLRL
jgi:hypothetical protein